nr:MAG TPA: hypothetical protein [Caudoviricetes sp.]
MPIAETVTPNISANCCLVIPDDNRSLLNLLPSFLFIDSIFTTSFLNL